MHAQQSQSFGAQQAYSQQISTMMPPPYQGLGATGFGGGFGQGGAYNYGGGGTFGYGAGNSFGNAATSFVGGAGSILGGAMPFIGGGLGFMKGGVGGAISGFGIGSMVGGAMTHVAGSFMEGAHEQASLERTLSQFQHFNASSRTGRGFSRTDSMAIGNMVRQMERIPEMLTSFGELNRVMDKMGQMGLMQGVRDAGEFMRKFKDTVGTLKDLAKVMGTTMEGALQQFGESRLSGFYSKSDITRNVLNRQITSSLTGMNQDQVNALQQFGSQLGHSAGGSRRTGANFATRTAAQLGMANRMGILSNDQIVEMTGKEGAEGIQDLSASMTQLGYRMGYSNVGQALTLALGEVKDGRYTGNMDKDLVERVRSGELGLGELKRLARSKAGTRGAKLSFAAHKERLRSEMVGAVGTEGIAMQLQSILGDRGWSNPDAINLVMQRFGASEEQANLLQQMMPDIQSIGSQMSLAGKDEGRRSALNAIGREHGWDAIKHRIGKKISHYTTDWAKDLGAGVRDYFQRWADDFLDDVSGQYRTYITQRVADSISTGGGALQGIRSSFGRVGNLGAIRMDVGSSGGISGLLARGAHFLSGDESAGERISSVIRGSGLGGKYLSESGSGMMGFIRKSQMNADSGNVALENGLYMQGSQIGNIKKDIVSRLTGAGADSTLAKARQTLTAQEFQSLQQGFRRAMESGDISAESDPKERINKILESMTGSSGALGSDVNTAIGRFGHSEAIEKLRAQGMGDEEIVMAFQKAMGATGRSAVDVNALVNGTLGGIDIHNQKAVSKKLEALDVSLTKANKGGETRASWKEIKEVLDKGGDAATLFAGKDGTGGLMRDADLRLLMDKDPSAWSPADKDKLQKLGIDPVKLAAKLNTPEGRKEIDKLRSASMGIDASDVQMYLDLTNVSGVNAINDKFRLRGSEAAARLSADSSKEAKARLSSTASGKKLLGMLNLNAELLKNFDASKAGGDYDNTADIVSTIRGLKGKDRQDALALAGDEIRATFTKDESLRKKLGKGGQSTQGVIDALGLGEVDGEFRGQIEKTLGKDKKLSSQAEIEALMKLIDSKISKGLTGKAGTETQNSYASEQEVSNALKTLSDNNVKMSAILSGIASGKGVQDSLSELGGKK